MTNISAFSRLFSRRRSQLALAALFSVVLSLLLPLSPPVANAGHDCAMDPIFCDPCMMDPFLCDPCMMDPLLCEMPPTANDDTANIAYGSTALVDVLTNDTDPEGRTLTLTFAESLSPGASATVEGSTVRVDTAPFDPDFPVTSVTITYRMTDGFFTAEGQLRVALYDGPHPVGDTATVVEGESVTIDPTVNDSGLGVFVDRYHGPNDEWTASALDVVDSGLGYSVITDSRGITLTPEVGVFGDGATFDVKYVLTNEFGDTATGVITTTVESSYTPPTAVDDEIRTRYDARLGEFGADLLVVNNDTSVLDVPKMNVDAIVEQPSNGTAQIAPDGLSILYFGDEGYHGTDTLTYKVSDGAGVSAPGTVTIHVNTPPTTVDDKAVAVANGDVVTVDVLANDSDADSDALKIASPYVGTSEGPGGTFEAAADGTVTYTRASEGCGTAGFTHGVEDEMGEVTPSELHVRINCAPDAVDDSADTDFETPVTVDVLANDSDSDGDGVTLDSLGTPSNGTAEIVGGKVVYTPRAGFSGTDTVTYTVLDGLGVSDEGSLTVTVAEKPADREPDPDPTPDPDEKPEQTVECVNVEPGMTATCVVSNIGKTGGTIKVFVQINPVLFDGLVDVSPDGTAEFSFDVPEGIEGTVAITVDDDQVGAYDVVLPAPEPADDSSPLPAAGASVLGLLAAALLLITGGSCMLRRRSTERAVG